jgi:hypothetical protein
MARESPVFQILKRTEVPDEKSGPGRGMIGSIVVFAVFSAFIMSAMGNIKKDPEVMAELRGTAA